jgi:hypothetical protein
MGNNLKVGSKKPNPSGRQTASQVQIPLPRMYQIAIRQERQRIIELLETQCKDQTVDFAIDLIKGGSK